ncbi:ABC transporter ATP-binding protein [Parerythrobacter aurantius]|uniref:ABC transporter ATP-binding protein n=1 Tax=Parerythrobacter aurantius TaxID=3127706 RepID=UPI00324F874E
MIRLLLSFADRRLLVAVAVLAVASALTEGVGFVMLVPLLAMVVDQEGGGRAASPVARWLDEIQFDPSLAVLLTGFAVLVLLRASIEYARTTLSLRFSLGIADRLRARAIAALLGGDWRVLSRMKQSENRALLISEIDRTALAADQLVALVRIAMGLFAIGLAALAISPLAALAGAMAGAGLLIFYGGMRRRAHDLGVRLGARYGEVHGLLEENLDALRTIKSFGAEDRVRGRLLASFAELRTAQERFSADNARARALLQVGGAILAAVAAWLALERWSVPAIVAIPLLALFARALPQVGALLDCWQQWIHSAPSLASADRLIRAAEAAAETVPGTVAKAPVFERCLTVERVSLAHRADLPALSDISLTMGARETIALVGPSGAGKSTLADIMGGLIAPDSGTMAIDGTPLGPAMRQAWRRQVAYVDQSPALFTGTVRDNLVWADQAADDARLLEVLHLAAAGFVLDLPGGLDCPLGDRGRQLSGGERQRIVLARALLRRPALLILDEATSALDRETDAAIARAIEGLAGTLAILIIGHRGALTALASRTIQLDQGRIVAQSQNA